MASEGVTPNGVATYKDTIGEPFPWLYMDADTLMRKAMENGYCVEVVAEGEHDNYMARITKIQTCS